MKIAIVNDLSIAVEAIRRVMVGAGHEIAWVAHNGLEAVEKCAQNPPDLILMDLIMPVLSGAEAVRRIMAESPCPIIIVTAAGEDHRDKVFEALGAGALDVVRTPVLGAKNETGPALLLAKIDNVGGRIRTLNLSQRLPSITGPVHADAASGHRLVAIGTSAGGPMALLEILSHLPGDFPAAVIIIQHLDAQFLPGLADWLRQHSSLPVRIANEGERPVAGTVLIAGTADHLVLTEMGTLHYTPEPVDNAYRPSVDVFFQSVAKNWHGRAVGVLLTGMGRDGARGLKALRDAHHHTISQDRATCAVYGMPKAAFALDAAVQVLPLSQVAPELERICVSSSH